MKKIAILLLSLLLLLPASMDAQRRKKLVKKPTPKKEEVAEEDPRIAQMLASTQRVVFIDSMVVDRSSFLHYIPLSPECGSLVMDDNRGQYTNELNDHRIAATTMTRDSLLHLTSSHLIGQEWTQPVQLKGIDNATANFPYLMPDGTTLYFAQQGDNSIGGYDIFVTRYDAERGIFLRPENIGMPFASESDDLLFVVDETYQLGYFVTDRRQPAGKVCIYVFIPSDTRRVYQSEAYSESQLRSLATIHRIADTWGDKSERSEALKRLAMARKARQSVVGKSRLQHTDDSSQSEIDEMRQQASAIQHDLQTKRAEYAQSTPAERQALRPTILALEQEQEKLLLDIKRKTKEIHNQQYQP